MPTDTELKKRGCPTKCANGCYGFGWYKFGPDYNGPEVRMSLAGARMGFRTKECPVCKANPNPSGQLNEPIVKR